MRRTLLFLCAASALCACGPLQFETEVKGTTVVTGSTLGGLLGVFPGVSGFSNIDFTQNQDFQNNKTSRDHVTSVRLTSLQVKITSPSDGDFSFLDSLQFFVRAGDQESLVAEKTGIAGLKLPPPNPVLNFDILDLDLAKFVQQPTMSFIVRGKGRQPSKDTFLEATVKLRVQAKIL